MKYKWSYYNIIEIINKDVIIYNTKTSAIIKINKDIYNYINSFFNESTNNLENDNNFKLLVQQGIIIDDSLNEKEFVKNKYLTNFYDKQKLNITILPIESCNLTCPYCFIYNYSKTIISDTLSDDIFKFIKNKVDARDKSKKFLLKINWYGGEPLLKKSFILSFMEKINEYISYENKNNTEKNSIKVVGTIITNGVFLNSKLFVDLCKVNIRSFQITFDGGKEFHDKTRCDINGNGSFDIIINNLKEIVNVNEKFLVSLRINFMKNSLNSVKPLIDTLKSIIKQDERFTIYCRPVYNFKTARDDINKVKNDILDIDEGLRKEFEFANYIQDKNFNKLHQALPIARNCWCVEDNDYSYIVGANGVVYKCDTLIGDKKFSIGKFVDGNYIPNETNKKWTLNIFQLNEFSKCYDCNLLPICFGGCKRNVFEHGKSCFITENQIRESLIECLKRG